MIILKRLDLFAYLRRKMPPKKIGSKMIERMYPMYFQTINQVASGLAVGLETNSAIKENVPKV